MRKYGYKIFFIGSPLTRSLAVLAASYPVAVLLLLIGLIEGNLNVLYLVVPLSLTALFSPVPGLALGIVANAVLIYFFFDRDRSSDGDIFTLAIPVFLIVFAVFRLIWCYQRRAETAR